MMVALQARLRRRATFSSVLVCCFVIFMVAARAGAAVEVNLKYDGAAAQLAFAAAEIRGAAATAKAGAPLAIELALDATLKPQGYRIERLGAASLRVTGGDANGAMYGGLDLAEALRLGTLDQLQPGDHTPYVAQRGIKFNIPLDLRTPSYSDNGDSFQMNIPEMWSIDFWHEFLDEMARQRFNVLSLWNLHPFPSIVKIPEFPDVALSDVWRTTLALDDKFSMSGGDMVQPRMLARHEVVKTMTIDQKIDFWREVLRYAKGRGIDVYWFTWNIFTWGAEGKYGITTDGNNPATIVYMRAAVRETVRTYPLLAGMGITSGENMVSKSGKFDHEAWLWQTYGEGIRDALKAEPGRTFRLIHRYHQTGQAATLQAFKDYPGPFDFSFKYSVAHMYSLTNPPFIKPVLEQMPAGMHTWLTVRNDDIHSFRWGDPDFARDYVRAMPGPERLAGFYMGPDGYCWGREFISREPESPRQLVLKKMWYSFMIWGRLAYDPALPDAHFERALAARFPQVPAASLYQAVATASKIIPQVTRFFWGDIDLKWFPEACTQRVAPEGFYTVKQFVQGVTMPGSGILNIRQWRDRLGRKAAMDGIAPPAVAEALEANAAKALKLIADVRRGAGDKEAKELRLMLGDAEAMAHLGHYYAEKIQGACALALFDASGAEEDRTAAVQHLESALAHWKKYAAVAMAQYAPQKLNRLGTVDLNQLTAKVAEDIAIAKAWKSGTVKGSGDVKMKNDNFRP